MSRSYATGYRDGERIGTAKAFAAAIRMLELAKQDTSVLKFAASRVLGERK